MGKGKTRQSAPGSGRSAMPGNLQFILDQGISLLQQGQLGQAEVYFRQVLAAVPQQLDALQLLGIIEYQMGRFEVAAELFQKAIHQAPNAPSLHCNRGLSLQDLGRTEEALACYERALAIKPGFVEALNNRGNALRELGRLEEAAASYQRVLRIKPDFAETLHNLGITLLTLEQPEKAHECLARCLQFMPEHLGALSQCGMALMALQRPAEALDCFEKILTLSPNDAEAHFQRGNALLQSGRPDEALLSYQQAISIRPDLAELHYNLGTVLLDLGRGEASIPWFDQALALQPGFVQALYNKGDALQVLLRHAEAIAVYEQLLELEPGYRYTLGKMFSSRQFSGDWTRYTETVESLTRGMKENRAEDMPFAFLAVSGDPALQLRCARAYTANEYAPSVDPLWSGEIIAHDRMRIAYVSADFREHPLSYLLAGVFEAHDRERFELIGITLNALDGSAMAQRVGASFDRMIDVSTMSDPEVAAMMRTLEVDIAVHLTGYTQNNRTAIFARRPAPIQINYLGFPGTMGANYMDYIIADEFVIPESSCQHYAEQVAYLPECFQGNDDKREISARRPSREELGLPESGFVFCAFNNTYKLTPPFFDIWMRLLQDMPDSVLWLAADAADVQRNLRAEAEKRGVAADRLVFCPRINYADHLARLQHADLFLDTLPFNAGTTASDALWAGVPVLTCVGEAFAGRMAGSLLKTMGLPELMTYSLEEYAAKARALANDPAGLAEIRARISRQRHNSPLFDTKRFCTHLEMAYRHMWDAYQRGEAPATFRLAPLEELPAICS